jgi:hypothetical protein
MSPDHWSLRLAIVLCAFAGATPLGRRGAGDVETGHTISGRVVDPYAQRPQEAMLMLGQPEGLSGFSSRPVPIAADGSFTTPRREPGVYVLEVVRPPTAATKRVQVVGQTIVRLASADVSGVTVEGRRETSLIGRYRMDSDDPVAEWPSHIHVLAFLAIDGFPVVASVAADGAPDGTFVLRNAFGPRVLRTGYSPVPASMWWPSKVLLDGKDVTNVPTDFSEHQDGQLEIFFTQHPASITGTVTDGEGQPAALAWVTLNGADRAAAQPWATTSDVTQADEMGRFGIAVPPGTYRVNAVPPTTFASREAARAGMSRIAFGGVTVRVAERETKIAPVRLQTR